MLSPLRTVLPVLALLFWLSLPGLAQQPPAAPPRPHPDVQVLFDNAEQAKKKQDWNEALRLYTQALTKSRSLQDKVGEAITLDNIGTVYSSTGQPQKAVDYYQQALPLYRQVGEKRWEATTLSKIGIVYSNTGQLEKALEYHQQCLLIRRQVGDKVGEAITLDNIGTVYSSTGQPQKAVDYYQQALPLYRQVGEKRWEAITLSKIGIVYSNTGQPQKALQYYQQALPIQREVGDRSGEANTLITIGLVYSDTGQPEKALQYLEQALSICKQAGDKGGEGAALTNIGIVYFDKGRFQEALQYYFQALPLHQAVGNKRFEANTLTNIGTVYSNIGQPQKALQYLEQAVTLRHEVGDKLNEANTLDSIGNVYSDTGQPQKALQYLEQARILHKQIGDKKNEAITLDSIGNVYSDIGQPQKALQYLEQAVTIQREVGDRRDEANTLNSIGNVYSDTGQPQKALQYLEQAQSIYKQVGDRSGESATLNNIGSVYSDIGQPGRALQHYEQARALQKQTGDKGGEAITLTNIGAVYSVTGQPEMALKYYQQALPIQKQVGDRRGEADTLNNIGSVCSDTGQPRKALEYYQQTLLIQRQVGDRRGEAITLTGIGSVYSDIGHLQKALAFLQQAQPIERQVGNKQGEAINLGKLALVQERQGHLADAQLHYQQALALLETVRTNLGGLSEAKSAFLASHLEVYYRYLALLLRRGQTQDAFALAQKTKARALLDLMYSGKVQLAQSLTPEEREKEQQLRANADQLNAAMVKEGVQNQPGAKKRFAALKVQLAQAQSQLQTFQDSLYARHPDLAQRRAAKTLTLDEVAAFLPEDTALLEYVVLHAGTGKDALDQTVLLVVTTQQGIAHVKAYSLPVKYVRMGQQSQALRLACANPRLPYRHQARQLYRQLVAPAIRLLAGKKRLILCPDAALWEVPFAVLNDGQQFLLQRYELDYAYSATGAQAACSAQHKKPAARMLALVNPYLGDAKRFGDNPNIPGQRPFESPSRPFESPSRPLGEPARDLSVQRGGGTIAALPGTEKEGVMLTQDFPGAVVYSGKQAQESTFKREASGYRYLHLASHAFFNDAAPLLSSVVLAQPVDNTEDGFLTAREIFDMNLNAEMVVLSACNTARGEKRGGEGIVGLTWALFAAGCPTQVVSQWSVDDASTAALMASFYGGVKRGQGKGSALRKAGLSLMRDGKHTHPYYWAPFVLVGDWR